MFKEYKTAEALPLPDKLLLEKAIGATANSYAPYSKFNVGAAVRMTNGEIVTGSNQENAASPSGLCAERVALFYAHHLYPSSGVEAIAIAAKSDGKITGEPTYPCGACVQVMVESQMRTGKGIKVIMGSATKIHTVDSIDELLPYSFCNLKEK